MPILGFVIHGRARWPGDLIDKDPIAVEALRSFKSKIKRRIVRFWHHRSELMAHFAISLATAIGIHPRRGWVRAPETSSLDAQPALRRNAYPGPDLPAGSTDVLTADPIDEVIKVLK